MKGLRIMKTNHYNTILRTLYIVPLYIALMLGLASCDLNYFPSDEQSSDMVLKEASSAVMDGCYSLLKDEIEYLGWPSGNTYCRHYFQLAEFPSDNICLSGKSTDPLFQATTYTMTDNLQNVGTLWMVGYKIIFMTNAVIHNENLSEDNADDRQILGEAYFMRALMHLNLVTLYAKPYHKDERGNLGIPLRTDNNDKVIKRDPVGDVYDQIVKDLRKAEELLGASRGNAGYPSKDAARGLLSRVYLYMEQYEDCINIAKDMLGGSINPQVAAAKLDANLASYFANAKTSQETLFCIAHEPTDDRGQSSIGSMYNAEGGGWGEVYPSFPLLNLYERYPQDVRYKDFIKPVYAKKATQPSTDLKVMIPAGEKGSKVKRDIFEPNPTVRYDASTGLYTFTSDGIRYTIENRLINGEYTEYYVNFNNEDLNVRIVPGNLGTRNTWPMYFVTKFGYQNGSPTLSSPVVLRWAEVILNVAEAFARGGDDQDKALELVNIIRRRAGIPEEGMFDANNMHGYANAIDVVMDERRLELAFEGHRRYDVYRNKQSMNRQYPGIQSWEVIDYTDNRIQYPIPNGEWTVSHIQQNDY